METKFLGIYRLRRFFTSAWMPTALALTVLAVLLGQFAVTGIFWLSRALEIVLLFSLVSILGAGIFQFAAKTWKKGLLSLLLFLGTVAVSFVSVIAVYLIGPPDYFGWDIVIPPDMVLEQPRDMMVAADRLANSRSIFLRISTSPSISATPVSTTRLRGDALTLPVESSGTSRWKRRVGDSNSIWPRRALLDWECSRRSRTRRQRSS